MYRGRSGPFHIETGQQGILRTAEQVLNEMLSDWMDDLVAGADLSRTSIDQMYPVSIYRHCQQSGQLSVLSTGVVDDFYSPVQPERYISLRLKPMMVFYQNRIPSNTRAALMMLLALGVFSVLASGLAFFGLAEIVVVITAAGASITSYLEFSDTQRKIERYTHAVRSIKKLLNWWTTLDAVERAGATATSKLLTTGESIISDERLAWQPMNIGEALFLRVCFSLCVCSCLYLCFCSCTCVCLFVFVYVCVCLHDYKNSKACLLTLKHSHTHAHAQST